MAGLRRLKITIAFLFLAVAIFFPSVLKAAPVAAQKPLLFLGDSDYPPVAYLENGVAKGMDVDLTKALAAPLHREVRVELMDWNLAQQKVLNGQADGLIGLSISPERQKTFDFAAPTFTRQFGLVIRANEMTIHGIADLSGKRVGVTTGGFPRTFFESQKGIQIVLVNNYGEGFKLLQEKKIDAVGADLWVAGYEIQKNSVRGVTILGKPFATAQEAVAVRKGNTVLLDELNRATTALRNNGTIAKIEKDWRPQQIVFASRREIRNLVLLTGGFFLALLLFVMAVWIRMLRRQNEIRKKTEQALLESEARYRHLTQAAFEGICISENGEILDVNNQFLEMFGYQNRDEVLGKRIIDMVASESRATISEAIRSNREEIFGHRLLRKDGTFFYGEARSKMVDVRGRRLRMTALRDVNERRQAEELNKMQIRILEMIAVGEPLQKTLDALLKMIESQSPEMLCSILLLDVDGIHMRHGAAPTLPPDYIKAVDGASIGEGVGSCGAAAFRKEPVFVKDIENDPLWAEYKHLALPHGLRACWSTPIFDVGRNVLGTFAIYYRQTGSPTPRHLQLIEMATHTAAICILKHHTYLALRESEEKFSKAFRTSPDVMSITDFATGRYLEVNDAHEKTFGIKREEAIGQSPTELGIFFDSDARQKMLENLREYGRFSEMEVEAKTRDGRTLALLHSAELIDLDGRTCVLRVSHDITERKQAETERAAAIAREQRARLEYTLQLIASQEAERARIAGELHDSLGQNLLLIKNYAQAMLANKEIDDELYQQVEAINGLATESIAEARSISHNLHPYQLDHLGLTRSLEAMIDKAAHSSGIIFQRKLDNVDDLFPKETAMNFYRLVQESLNNILKHSQAGNARIALERDIHEVQLSISDDGRGFSLEKNGKGMGLKNIAERTRIFGGKWKVDSAPGKGTRVEITIPISVEAE